MNKEQIQEVAKGFIGYVKAGIKRWFSPRVYIVAVTYEDTKTGKLMHESSLVQMWKVDIHALTECMEKPSGFDVIHIDSVTELAGAVGIIQKFDPVNKIAQKAEKLAEEIKQENSPASSLNASKNALVNNDDDDEIAVDSFIQNK